MAWTKGFNFRSTSGFNGGETAEQTYVIGDSYPQTRNSVTFGWLDTPGKADRNGTGDARFSGINYAANSGTQLRFQIDLPAAGTYDVRLVLGDTASQTYQYVQILDNATPVLTIDDTDGTASGFCDDATGTNMSHGAWPGSNTAVSVTFATTTCLIKLGPPSAHGGDVSSLMHVFLDQTAVGGAGDDPPRLKRWAQHLPLHAGALFDG